LALVGGDYQAERALFGAQRLTIDRIDDEGSFAGEIVVEFGYGEDGTIAVAALGDKRERHTLAAQRGTLRDAGLGQQRTDRNAIVLVHLVIVALGCDGFAGQFL